MRSCKINRGEIIERRRRFFSGEMRDRILLSIHGLQHYQSVSPQEAMEQAICIPSYGEWIDRLPSFEVLAKGDKAGLGDFLEIADDHLPIIDPCRHFGHASMVAALGFGIRYFSQIVRIGSDAPGRVDSIEQLLDLTLKRENNPMLDQMAELIATYKQIGGEQMQLSPYMFQDGLHVLTQLRGYEPAYLDLYDEPELVHRFFDRMVGITSSFFDFMTEQIGPYVGGWTCDRVDWTPGRCISLNLDDYLACANDILIEFGLPYLQRLIDHAGYGLIHYHTPDTRLLPEVMKLKNVAIQIGSDLHLPDPIETIGKLREITGDVPLTWIRIKRDDFMKRVAEGSLPGGVEYVVENAIDIDDANRLAAVAREYRADS